MIKSELVRGEVDEGDDVDEALCWICSGSSQDISASFLEFSANIFSTAESVDEVGEETQLFPFRFLFEFCGLMKPSNFKNLSGFQGAPPLSRTILTGALSSRGSNLFEVESGAGGLAVGKGFACNLSARGRAGAREENPPAKDLTGTAAPGHCGCAVAPGHGGGTAAAGGH